VRRAIDAAAAVRPAPVTRRYGAAVGGERGLRVALRVHPRAARAQVGGSVAGALVVRVRQAPTDGRATTAALVALADALGVARRRVRLVTGASSRSKVVEIDVEGDRAALLAALADLSAAPSPPDRPTTG